MALLIFFLALIFRVTNIDLIEFKADEAINLLLALNPTFGGTVSSLGVLNPPLFNYILFPIALINSDPKFVVFFIGLLNAAAIALLYLIVKKYYGLTIALIFGVLFSLSPWAIIYSRKIWMQDLIIPFFVPVFYSIHKLAIDKKTVYWVPYTIFCLFLIQLHQISIIFVGLLTFFLILKKVNLNWKYISIGIIIGVLPLLPYVTHQLNNNCPDCQALISARGRLTNERSLETFQRPWQILSQGNFRFILGNDTLTFAQKFPAVDFIRRIFYLEYLLIPLGLFLFAKKFKNLRFISFTVALLPITYFALKIEPFMHYFIITIPFLFLFLAVAINSFLCSRLLLSSLAITSIVFNFAFFELLRSKGSLQGDYGTVYHITEKEVRQTLTEFEKREEYNEIYLSSFIPLSYVYGYQPLGKILYSNISYENVLALESKLRQGSKDPRVKQKIISFYTKEKPNLETLDFLHEKASNIPQYEPLYRQILGEYLSINFKKEYIWHEGGFRFFYPEHWKIENETKSLKIIADQYELSINSDGKVSSSLKTKDVEDLQKSIRPL